MNTSVLDPWDAIADELVRAAADLRQLRGHPAPGQFQLNVQPCKGADDDATRANVDAVAEALGGKPAVDHLMGDGRTFRWLLGVRGPLDLSVYTSLNVPKVEDKGELYSRGDTEPEEVKVPADTLLVDQSDHHRDAPRDGNGGE